MPTFTTGFDPTSENDCVAGKVKCVDAVIKEMTKRFTPLGQACNHNAMFSLMYLRTTQMYRTVINDPNYFTDNAFVNHQDVVFARLYFDAWDAYRGGHVSDVPQAWRKAFAAADQQKVSGTGNMLLGMSAHVNRDLPFALESIGMIKPDGSSRKPDHDKVNQFLNQVVEPLFTEAAAHYDDTVDDGNIPGTTIDETATLQLLVSWREGAWRNAERLAAATTPLQRAMVEASIENMAAHEADLIIAATAYSPLSGGAAARNTFCATHRP
jgi:hypothetical protein